MGRHEGGQHSRHKDAEHASGNDFPQEQWQGFEAVLDLTARTIRQKVGGQLRIPAPTHAGNPNFPLQKTRAPALRGPDTP